MRYRAEYVSVGHFVVRSWRSTVVGVLAAASVSSAAPVLAQQTVYAWVDPGERIELQVKQLVVTPPTLSPGLAEAYLAEVGFGDFDYVGPRYCVDGHLFSHPDASAAPILAAVETLGADPSSPFFWTFDTDLAGVIGTSGGLAPHYWVQVGEAVDPDALLEALGIETTFHEFYPPSGWGVVYPATRSAVEMLAQLDRLNDSAGVLQAFVGLPSGCPSGGPGPGPPAVVPAAGQLALAVFALMIVAVAAQRLGSRRRAAGHG